MRDMTKWLGKPYRTPLTEGVGFQCWQFAYQVMTEEFKSVIPDYSECSLEEASMKIITKLEEWNRIPEPEEGCLVILNVGEYVHCGVMVDERKFIHILPNRESTIEDIEHRIWRNRIEGFYKWNI